MRHRLGSRWGWAARASAAHGLTSATWAGLGVTWLISVVTAAFGIPHVDPLPTDSPRPLETLGMVMAVLPTARWAEVLADRVAWLTSSSPRRPERLRLRWAVVSAAGMLLMGLAWVLCLPSAVPIRHAFGTWVLLGGCAAWAAVVLRADLAVVGPMVVVVPLSIGGLVPFGYNVIYNVELESAGLFSGVLVLVSGLVGYARWGDGEARRET